MSAEELVDVVDEQDQVIGQARRADVRARRLRHRSCYIFLFNDQNQIFVHRRTVAKDIYPGYYDVAFGGLLGVGETYEQGAQRELAEEAGITDVALRPLFRFPFDDDENHVLGMVFTATHNGPLTLQAAEIESGEWMDLDAVVELAQRERFCPDGIAALSQYLDRLDQARQRRG